MPSRIALLLTPPRSPTSSSSRPPTPRSPTRSRPARRISPAPRFVQDHARRDGQGQRVDPVACWDADEGAKEVTLGVAQAFALVAHHVHRRTGVADGVEVLTSFCRRADNRASNVALPSTEHLSTRADQLLPEERAHRRTDACGP